MSSLRRRIGYVSQSTLLLSGTIADNLRYGHPEASEEQVIRAAQAAALLEGRDYVTPDDLKSLFVSVCAHRVVSKSYLHDGHTVSAEQILNEILRTVSIPE